MIKEKSNDDHWQNVLTDMLKFCRKIKVQTSSDANLNRSNLNLLELYFDDFLNETKTLIRNGVNKKYSKGSSNVKALTLPDSLSSIILQI